jgi:flavin reductase (DIM6/NTAB) family NADH-FMN oxidoreductase RutF
MPKIYQAFPSARFFGYYPGTIAVVTVTAGGRRNAMSAGWHTALSADPPLYGVALGLERHTHALVSAAGAFALNFLPYGRADLIRALGSTSGRDVDKFAALDLACEPGRHGASPILAEAYLAYECRLAAVHRAGDHDLFVGEVLAVHHEEAAYDQHGVLRPERAQPAVYLGRGEFRPLASSYRAQLSDP